MSEATAKELRRQIDTLGVSRAAIRSQRDRYRDALRDADRVSDARIKGYKAHIRRQNELLKSLEMALREMVEVAAQYLDTGRGDLDGAIDAARRLLSTPHLPPEPPVSGGGETRARREEAGATATSALGSDVTDSPHFSPPEKPAMVIENWPIPGVAPTEEP